MYAVYIPLWNYKIQIYTKYTIYNIDVSIIICTFAWLLNLTVKQYQTILCYPVIIIAVAIMRTGADNGIKRIHYR